MELLLRLPSNLHFNLSYMIFLEQTLPPSGSDLADMGPLPAILGPD